MTFKILSHNAYWFQGHPFSPDTPADPVPEIQRQLATLYRVSGADLICLQEIQSSAAAEALGRLLGRNVLYQAGNLFVQYGVGTAASPDASLEALTSTADIATIERAFHICRFRRNGLSLTVANVHLTSGRQTGKATAGTVRLREMETLLASVSILPDFVLGDFNEAAGGALSDLLKSRGFSDAAELAGDAGGSTMAGGKRIDQIWIGPMWRQRLTGYGVIRDALLVRDPAGETRTTAKTHLSDHYPVWASFE